MRLSVLGASSIMVSFVLLACGDDASENHPSTCASADPCGTHGTCSDGASGPTCACASGYDGTACDTCASGFHADGSACVVDGATCASADPCGAHGTCSDGASGPTCACASGYDGTACDTCASGFHADGSACVVDGATCASADPCGAHGTCSDGASGPTCACASGYDGSACDTCASGFHADGSACVADGVSCAVDSCSGAGACTPGVDAVVCACDTGNVGPSCAACDTGWHRDGVNGPCLPDVCDPGAQDCDEADYNCTLVSIIPTDPASALTSACVLTTGSVAEAGACLRTPSTGPQGIGHDDCDVGLYCSGIGLALGSPPSRACRAFCESGADCVRNDEACLSIDVAGPLEGICMPTCGLLALDTCESGWTCGMQTTNDGARAGFCRIVGAAAAGEACSNEADCQADMACASNADSGFVCRAMCDGTTSCAAGTCATQTWLPDGVGICLPSTCIPGVDCPPTTAGTGTLGTPRVGHTATMLASGKVLIAGGNDRSASAEVYDPATGLFTATGSMTTGHSSHTATLLPSGKVLITGGVDVPDDFSQPPSKANAELYDPVTNQFTSAGTMKHPRAGHSATPLRNGRVLIVGGEGQPASAEIYDPATGTFTATGSLATGRLEHSATLLRDGRVLIAGGFATNGGLITTSAELYDPSSATFTTTGPLAAARHRHVATLLPNGRVLVVGGDGAFNDGSPLASAEVYDPAAGTFAATGAMTAARIAPTVTSLPSGRVLVTGGLGVVALASVDIYDPTSGLFVTTTALGTARAGHSATLLRNGKVLVVGGDNLGVTLATAELYAPTDLAPGHFTFTGSIAAFKTSHTATRLLSGQVLIAGGDAFGAGAYTTAERYDPGAGTFSVTGAMSVARANHTATLLASGKVLVAGGGDAFFGGPATTSAELYDATGAGTFSTTGAMTKKRVSHAATLLFNGQVLMTGGRDDASVPVATAERYDPIGGTFSATGVMQLARSGHTATRLPNGKVLVVGGVDQTGTRVAAAEVYDPSSGLFTATGSLATARSFHTATLLFDGRVLVVGGASASDSGLTSAELYDPASGTFKATGDLHMGRGLHTATLLDTGKVLVAGGSVGTIPMKSAELYDPDTGAFATTSPMGKARQYHTAALLLDGRVLVVSGEQGLDTAEVFDPEDPTRIGASSFDDFERDAVDVFPSAWLDTRTIAGPALPSPSAKVAATTDAYAHATHALTTVDYVTAGSQGVYRLVPKSLRYTVSADVRVDQFSDNSTGPLADWAIAFGLSQVVGADFASVPQVTIYTDPMAQHWRIFAIGAAGASADIDFGPSSLVTVGTWYHVELDVDVTTGVVKSRVRNIQTGTLQVDRSDTITNWKPADASYNAIAFFDGEYSAATRGNIVSVDNIELSTSGSQP